MAKSFASSQDVYVVEETVRKARYNTTYKVKSERTSETYFLKYLTMQQIDDWKILELYEREAKVLQSVSHDGIPEYIEDFSPEKGEFCLVQSFVEGQSLQSYIDTAHTLSHTEFEAYLRQVLVLLDYLHTCVPPTFHRDISPSNMMVTLTPQEEGPAKLSLVDFGAVRVSVASEGEATTVGTFGYMAPEQLLGRVGPESDLYGVGMSFLALATYKAPSALPLDTAAGRREVEGMVKLPPHLVRVLMAMIEPAQEKRPQSAAAVLEMLDNPALSLVHERPSLPLRVRLHRWGRKMAAVAGLCVAILFVGWLTTFHKKPHEIMTLGGWFSGHGNFVSAVTLTLFGSPNLLASPEYIKGIAFSPDRKKLASFVWGNALVWDATSGSTTAQRAAVMDAGRIKKTIFTKQQDAYLMGDTNITRLTWDKSARGYKKTQHIYPRTYVPAHNHRSEFVDFAMRSPKQLMAFIENDYYLYLFDLREKRELFHKKLWGRRHYALRTSFQKGGKRFALNGLILPPQPKPDLASRIAYRKRLRKLSLQHTIRVWSLSYQKESAAQKKRSVTIQEHKVLSIESQPYEIEWSPKGPRLAIRLGHKLLIWNAKTRKYEISIGNQRGIYSRIAWSPDGSMIADATGRRIHIYNTASGKQLRSFVPGYYIETIAWSRDSRVLASAGSGQVITLWSAPTPQKPKEP